MSKQEISDERLKQIVGAADYRRKEMFEEFMEDVFSALTELQARRERERWIPVGEAVPEVNETVQFVMRGDFSDPVCGHLMNTISRLVRWMGSDSVESPLREFTHWRPLPIPPEVK